MLEAFGDQPAIADEVDEEDSALAWPQGTTLVEFGFCVSAGLLLGLLPGARRGISITLEALEILYSGVDTTER